MREQTGHLAVPMEESRGPAAEAVDEPFSDIDGWHQRLDKQLQSISAGIARLERKLDRILALSVESRRTR